MKKSTFIKHQKSVMCMLVCLCVLSVISAVKFSFSDAVDTAVVNDKSLKYCIVIDAGHGGEDGGAVGVNGSVEKNINLSIATKLESILRLCGVDCVMTRHDDVLLYKDGQESRKKFYDVRNRVDIVNSATNPILISIHQNKFPLEKYSGLQVYFSPNNAQSSELAYLLQNNTKTHIQPENNREIKASGKNIYLLNNLNCPAVLVECGFLSNSNEERLLSTEEYQRKIAFILFKSVSDFVYKNSQLSERKV